MPGRIILPPIGADKESCEHLGNGPKTHRCFTCKGVLRRCCDSVVGYDHKLICAEMNRGVATDDPGPTRLMERGLPDWHGNPNGLAREDPPTG
jgi:hypothetical protein